jgi:tetratricopeptide (TPR) repeat protein
MLNYKLLMFGLVSMAVVSCKKGWIEKKSNQALDVPNTVTDYQALLDNSSVMNDQHPALGEVSADNYFCSDNAWLAWASQNKNAYVWEPDIYNNTISDDGNWNKIYKGVFYANVVLDGIDDVETGKQSPAWNNVKGSALFYRGEAFFSISQVFTKPYGADISGYPGIPLRLSADPNEISVRASLEDTYQQIVKDLQGSLNYLPNAPVYKVRPSKPAAYAMLSRLFLVMQDYPTSLLYADSCLKLYDSVLNYNTLNAASSFPIPGQNREVIFHSTIADPFSALGVYYVDSSLYKSYDNNDLRKVMFYKAAAGGQQTFIGTYTGGTLYGTVSKSFGGIATDEIYLTRAECYARTGKVTEAMNDLNKLLLARWKSGLFVPFTAANADEALAIILRERRKETPFRGLRWLDLRRLNSGGANITLTRKINGQLYTLPPNDPRYALPIPPDVISLTGMQQNER